jgi:hypothetical protein
VARTVKIRGEQAQTHRVDKGYRLLGWLLLIVGSIWMAWNFTREQVTLTSWTLEQVALPFLLIGLAVFAFRASANERIEFDRVALTVRRSSQFRTRVEDLSGVKKLFADFPSLRDWTRRYWQPTNSTAWSDWSGTLPSDDLLLLMAVTEVFDDALLQWWLDKTP